MPSSVRGQDPREDRRHRNDEEQEKLVVERAWLRHARLFDRSKALADAKANKEVSTARTDAANDKREADYKVAVEKCDALAGDAKASCVAEAKARYGKS
jgi:hypothetical protein